MGLFAFFDSKQAQQLGSGLAGLAIEHFPEGKVGSAKKAGSKYERMLQRLQATIEQFRKKQVPLNIYQRARMANEFKWRLKESGFAEAAVDDLTRFILTRF